MIFLIGVLPINRRPSGKSATRPQPTREEITPADTYKQQIFRSIRKDRIRFNSEWMDKLGSDGFTRLAAHHCQTDSERDDFAKRLEAERPIALHELLIRPQATLVALEADVELGGTDQSSTCFWAQCNASTTGSDLRRHAF